MIEPMKSPTEMVEGRQAFQNFDATMRTLLSVPHSEIQRREREYQKRAKQNPHRRGPKRKARR
jgi:hypothetical protein